MEGGGTSASSEPLLPSSSASAQNLTLRSISDVSSNVSNRSETTEESSIRRPSPLSRRILVATRNSKVPLSTGIGILLSGIILGCVVPKQQSTNSTATIPIVCNRLDILSLLDGVLHTANHFE